MIYIINFIPIFSRLLSYWLNESEVILKTKLIELKRGNSLHSFMRMMERVEANS